MEVLWHEQAEAEVPSQNDWFGERELTRLEGIRVRKRRADWRLGRWTAKRAVARCLNLPCCAAALATLEILAAPDGAPEAFLAGLPVPLTVSLSHRAGVAVCAVAPQGVALGCDLELVEPRDPAFVTDYFTPEEQTVLARAAPSERPRLITLLWSAKESAVKALRVGLRLDTRRVIALPSGTADRGGWYPLQVRHEGGRVFNGWWYAIDETVRTFVSDPPTVLPPPTKGDTLRRPLPRKGPVEPDPGPESS